MRRFAKALLARILRLPHDPVPPAGAPESVLIFRAAENYYRYTLVSWSLKQVGALLGIIALLLMNASFIPVPELPEGAPESLKQVVEAVGCGGPVGLSDGEVIAVRLFTLVERIGIVVLLLQMPFTLALVRLNYEMRWYIVTDRSVRIREGVGRVRELTMSLANIQNLSIRQGPIQRLLGISDLRVRTAGGGEGGNDGGQGNGEESDSGHVGYFRGVGDATAIRDLLLTRLRAVKSGGLGDPDDREEKDESKDAVAAAKQVLSETRLLARELRR